MRPKIIIITKKRLMMYAALLLILVIAALILFTMRSSGVGLPSSGYTYLKYKDGTFVGNEKTEHGNIRAEVIIKNEKISDIKLTEFPPKYINENPTLKDEIPQHLYNVIQNQDFVPSDSTKNTTYILNKITKAIRNAVDQSLIE
ncbi:MAG: hypothetical protein A2Y23_11575 [Clostridiales bacterium GWB2_37_7]|nr:MAG: hypothetical protein A2Y23_11575 [Clostridiales bacterium GWB2_37_7]